MKKFFAVALVSAVLVAALPSTASAFDSIGSHKGCRTMILRPCPNQMPPISSGSTGGWTRGGGSSSTGSGSGSTSNRTGGGINTRPAPPSAK